MRRNVKKAAAFLLAFALIFSMAGSGRVIVSAQQSTEMAETLETAKTQETPSTQSSMPSTDESMENSQNTSEDSVESPSEPEGGTAGIDTEKDENGTDSKDPSNPTTPSTVPSEEEPSSEVSSSEEPSTEESSTEASSTEASSTEESSSEVSSTPETDGEEEMPVETETETETGTDEDSQPVSGNDVPEESASEGSVSGNSVSGNGIASNGIALLAIRGPIEVQVGSSIVLTGSNGWNHSWSWESNDGGAVGFDNTNERSVTVTGVAEGTVRITHKYNRSYFGGRQQSESYDVTVTAAGEATYNLYMYTLIPGVEEGSGENPDLVWNGMGVGSISGVSSPASLSVDRIVDNGYGSSGADIEYNEGQYPNITVDGVTYQYARTEEQESQEGYYTISWMRVIVANGANAGNNGHNETVASGTNTYHLDGVLILNEKNKYTVNFALKDAGETAFSIVEPEKYSRRVDEGFEADLLSRPDVADSTTYPSEKIVNGITYTFDGWYKDEACTERVDWETETITKNTTYYARYVPSAQTITVTKDVTGGLGDIQKDFTFSYSYMDASGSLQEGSFNLRDGGSEKISGIPVGAELTLIEENAGGYSVSATYGNVTIDAREDKSSNIKTLKITIDKNNEEITVINDKEVTPDTGILLDSTPHALALILITGCAAAFIIGRRKRHFS